MANKKKKTEDRIIGDIVEVGRIVVDADGSQSIAEAEPLRFGESISPAHATAWKSARLDATRSASHAEQAEVAGVRAAVVFARAYGSGGDLPRLVDAAGEPLRNGPAWAAMHAREYRGSGDDSAASRAIAAARVVVRNPEAAEIGSVEALATIDRTTRGAVKARTAAGEDAGKARKSVIATERAAVKAASKKGQTGADAKRTIVAKIDAKRGADTAAADAKKSADAKSARAAASGTDAAAVGKVLGKALLPGGCGVRGIAVAVGEVEGIEADTVAALASALMEVAAEIAAR